MTLTSTLPPPAPRAPDLLPGRPPCEPGGDPPRLLAVVTELDGALPVLDRAYSLAREEGHEVHTALLLPRVPFTLDAQLASALAAEHDREVTALVTLAAQRATAHGVKARITVHRLGGLRGRRRGRVLGRAVARLARRLDAVPVGNVPS
ncbi:hypothetical protein [Blastococcus sp. SYSU D01042]